MDKAGTEEKNSMVGLSNTITYTNQNHMNRIWAGLPWEVYTFQ